MLPGFIVECVPDGGMEFAEALYVAHYQSMYRIARGIVRDTSAAEDVVHDAFLEAVKRLELLREMRDGGRAAYLATIARSRAYNYLRREKLVQPEEADFLEEHGGVEDNACDQALLRLDYEQAGQLVDRLPDRLRTVFVLHYAYARSDGEIAQLTGIAQQSVRVYLHRARQMMRKIAGEEGIF